MKKSLIFAGAIFLTSGIAIAKTIDFDTSIKWNSNVVERALNKSGFLGSSDASWDVRATHERILAELLKMESFSVRDATRVCLNKCNMSDFLKNGRGASGKKCPDLCSSFALQLINENNGQVNLNVMNPNLQDSSFSNSEGKPSEICQQLVSKAQGQGLTMPMLCGGKCYRFGDDKIIVTDNIKTIEFTVDDFCDGEGLLEEKEYYMIVSSNGAQDVTRYSEYGRLVELKKAQSKPASDYIKMQEQRKKESTYANLVRQNGNCKYRQYSYKDGLYTNEQDIVDVIGQAEEESIKYQCRRFCKIYAINNKCKIQNISYKPFPTVINNAWRVGGFCGCNGGNYEYKQDYSYTPTYQDCMKENNRDETKCNN